jgi:hypothetical protein
VRNTGSVSRCGAFRCCRLPIAIASDFDADGRFPISDRRSRPLILVGRLKPGVTRAQADAQLKVIAAAHEQAYPDDNKNQDLVVGTLERLDISTRPQDDTQTWLPMGILQGLAATVLLTSCLNLANMMLAFGSARQKERRDLVEAGALAVFSARFGSVPTVRLQHDGRHAAGLRSKPGRDAARIPAAILLTAISLNGL